MFWSSYQIFSVFFLQYIEHVCKQAEAENAKFICTSDVYKCEQLLNNPWIVTFEFIFEIDVCHSMLHCTETYLILMVIINLYGSIKPAVMDKYWEF